MKFLVCFFLFFASCALSKNIQILAFGDSGTGDKIQMDVAASMQRVCQKDGCDFALLLGDNFYENGVGAVDDDQFISKFEKPYGPLKLPFYVSLGNHDDRGDTQAQVDYTKKSQWWKLPSPYYTVDFGMVKIIAIYSNDFSEKQKLFVEDALSSSKAVWNIVFGHHPIKSYGNHGSTPSLVQYLLPTLCRYPSAFYVSGHDHDLQVLQEKGSCSLPMVISGASAKLRQTNRSPGSEVLWSSTQYGFSRLDISDVSITVIMYSKAGDEIYRHDFALPKNPNLPGHGASRYVPLNEEEKKLCDADEMISGIEMDMLVEKHIKGFFCSKTESLSGSFPGKELLIDGLAGNQYDVFCPEPDQKFVGITYDPKADRHIRSAFCRDGHPGSMMESSVYYISIQDEFQKSAKPASLDVRCQSDSHSIVGVRYRDVFDRQILGIYCRS